ncbi:MAG: hypothetical protein NTW17_00595 [Candidatus Pacearchaeota archaeon]|nr:hypothetical protein [Candidatus Pacearchaeota archaeon]
MNNKKGLSAIVATLIIILLTLVAVGIVWIVIRNVIQSGAEQTELGLYSLDLEIKSVQLDGQDAIITVKRNVGEGEFVGMNFIFSNGTDSETIRENVSLDELETKSIIITLTNLNVSTLTSVSVIPIYQTSSGKESSGNPTDVATIPSGSGSSGGRDTGESPPGGGAACNNNGTCDTGETTSNCPGDCPVVDQILITTCREINSPGSYILQNNLTGNDATSCLNIHDASQVYIDCANKTILSTSLIPIEIINVTDFSLKNCRIIGLIDINWIEVQGSSNGLIMGNSFLNTTYQQSLSNDIIIQNNIFNWLWTTRIKSASINLIHGTGNTVKNNFVYGNGPNNIVTGIETYPFGIQYGILIQNESEDTVFENTIQNVLWCGIDTAFLSKNNNFSNNIIKTAWGGLCGNILNSMQNNTYAYNRINNSNQLFSFARVGDLLPGENFIYFTNNNFMGNVITNVGGNIISASIMMNSISGIGRSELFIASNNTFTNNDFGFGGYYPNDDHYPSIYPSSSVIDGGGNICGTPPVGGVTQGFVCH